jgi:hypothetical protein
VADNPRHCRADGEVVDGAKQTKQARWREGGRVAGGHGIALVLRDDAIVLVDASCTNKAEVNYHTLWTFKESRRGLKMHDGTAGDDVGRMGW